MYYIFLVNVSGTILNWNYWQILKKVLLFYGLLHRIHKEVSGYFTSLCSPRCLYLCYTNTRLSYQALISGGSWFISKESSLIWFWNDKWLWGVVLLIGMGVPNITVGGVNLFVWEEHLFVGEVTDNDHVLVSLTYMQNKSVLSRA